MYQKFLVNVVNRSSSTAGTCLLGSHLGTYVANPFYITLVSFQEFQFRSVVGTAGVVEALVTIFIVTFQALIAGFLYFSVAFYTGISLVVRHF